MSSTWPSLLRRRPLVALPAQSIRLDLPLDPAPGAEAGRSRGPWTWAVVRSAGCARCRGGWAERTSGRHRHPGAMLEAARTFAENESLGNVDVMEDDLFASALEPTSFDLVHARFQLAPARSLRGAGGRLPDDGEPGGVIVSRTPTGRPGASIPTHPRRSGSSALSGRRSWRRRLQRRQAAAAAPRRPHRAERRGHRPADRPSLHAACAAVCRLAGA